MDQEIAKPSKWEAKVSTRLAKANADQIWTLIKDFFGILKYFPNLPISHGIQGNNGEVGSIRYCEGFVVPDQERQGNDVNWAKEKLIAIDHTQRSLSYEILDSNIGFNSYVSTIKVVDDAGHQQGCFLEWSFSVDPIQGIKMEDMAKNYEVWLLKMAQNLEADALEKSLEK